ncbi:MAG TPA: acyl-CoA synthetase [Polyangiales bacterium]|nr:acyl-CoA synthetase [Polyangiales bacterium]
MSTQDTIPLIARAHEYSNRTAIVAADGQATFAELLELSERAARVLLNGRSDLQGDRVAFLISPSLRHVVTQWAIFRAGGVAVPLCVSHPAPELAHVLDDSQPIALVADREFDALARPLAEARKVRWLGPQQLTAVSRDTTELPRMEAERPAMLIYTSGTTGKPKAAITTHAIFAAQMQAVATAWELAPSDRILHALPLHHLHGVLNALSSVLFAGGTCELLPRFDAELVWQRLCAQPGVTLFMGVPTMYDRLAAAWSAADSGEREARSAACRALRLMVSGSAALPVSMLERWRAISGHVLLERYGMTELGMALGNPLKGERRPGTVGLPFPGVEARLIDSAADGSSHEVPDGPGELQIRGPNVFAGYFGKPDASSAAFTRDGFFRTGDIAVRENGYYRLLGRESVDIIKTGGYKVSALEIEEELREHPAIAEVSVVGVPDESWGERVAAAVILRAGQQLELAELRSWAKERLAPYKVPSLLQVMSDLPRNALGKVVKPELKRTFG